MHQADDERLISKHYFNRRISRHARLLAAICYFTDGMAALMKKCRHYRKLSDHV